MSWDDSIPTNHGFKASVPEPHGHSGFTGSNDAYGDDNGGGRSDGACRNCGMEGHFSRECPDKPANDGACFNCGQQGHNKADCSEPRVFSGACRHCGKEGHMHKDCPDRPPEVCRNCREEGHIASDCINNRFVDKSNIIDKSPETAWADMEQANREDDFDAFKISMLEYMKACPEARFNELENTFRREGFEFYLYALTREPDYHECIVGPNGEPAKYIWTLNRSARPRRSKAIKDRMAPTPEENLERLKFAGDIMPETKPFCHVCKVKGHAKRGCQAEEPERERERVVLKCGNCDALDHRLRDCPQPRKPDYNPMECKNCHEEGHKASDCPMPRVADENTECRKCNGIGHFSRDCPQGGGGGPQVCFNCGQEGHRSSDCTNEKVFKCRNCDAFGHSARECPKPRDISRVKCNNCGEMGHYNRNCNNPSAEQGDGGYRAYGGGASRGGGQEPAGALAWETNKTANESESVGAWETMKTAPEPEVEGGWDMNDFSAAPPSFNASGW